MNGLSIREDTPENTGDLYGAMALDEDWVIINQMIKYYKFGFGRATDYLNLDIRNNLISRERAIKIVEKYDGVCSGKYINSFCDYLEISKEEFWKVVSNFVNKDIFTINNKLSGNKYIPKFKVGKRFVKKISIIDYGCANYNSIKNTLKKFDCEVSITTNLKTLKKQDIIILPGVGTFPRAMKVLNDKKLIKFIKNAPNEGKKF